MPLKWYVLIRCYQELLIRFFFTLSIFSLFTSTFKLTLIERLSTIYCLRSIFLDCDTLCISINMNGLGVDRGYEILFICKL